MLYTLLLISTAVFSVQAVRFNIKNLEFGPIWVAIRETEGHDVIEEGGFELGVGKTRSVTVPDNWEGKLWPRTWCGWPKHNECLTGDCGQGVMCASNNGTPPYSLIDITLNGKEGYDYYSVSMAYGYNIGVSIEPINGIKNASIKRSCVKAACAFKLDPDCPEEFRVDHGPVTIACQSPCLAMGMDEHCCHKNLKESAPDVCKSSAWMDTFQHFKKLCPQALNKAYDRKKIFRCKADVYRINFGAIL